MSALDQALEQYLSTRHALGFKLRGYRSRLSDFVAYVDQVGATTITSELALAWATKPTTSIPTREPFGSPWSAVSRAT